nr:uncharacterized protein CTRU02_09706 [Colletotrichum truncatum]KAF6788388.1 hypothetical protein CTRU02_09706 [Colletotrichum truncatum]
MYCCVYPNRIEQDPGIKEGFPIHRQCTKMTGSCMVKGKNGQVVKSKNGQDLVALGACC